MRFLLALLAALCAAHVSRAEEDHVVVLGKANFTDFLKANERVLVEFYAPWCGHCKRLEPEYKKAAAQLHEQKAKTKLAKIDATQESELAQEHGVSGYPTIKYFVNEKGSEYNGEREAPGIASWLLKRELPAVVQLEGAEKVQEFVQGKDFAVVGYVVKNSKRDKQFRSLAQQFVDGKEVFGLVTLPKEQKDKVKLEFHRPKFSDKHDAKVVEYKASKWEYDALDKWMSDLRYPFIAQDFEAAKYAWNRDRITALVSVNPSERESMYAVLEPIVEKLKGKVYFTFVDPSSSEAQQVSEQLGLKGAPEVLLLDQSPIVKDQNARMVKHRLAGPLNKETLTKFFADFEAGKLPAYKKSAALTSAKDGNVQVLVADNWEQIVLDPKLDVFVEYYAPWCGHCKKLAPAWERLAETVHLKHKGKVVIAKMDATANDVEDADVQGYPTLIMYPAGKRKMRNKIKYSKGEREFETLLEWVEENSENLSGGSDEL